MPVLLGISFVAQGEIPPSEITPDRVHALFFSSLSEDLARELHRPSRLKPFSLWFKPYLTEEKPVDRILLEVSFLKEDLFPRFLSGLITGEEREARIGEVKLKKLKKPRIAENRIVSYEELYENAAEEPTIVMDFITPTTFKKGESDYPLPEPSLIFRSLIRKWVAFSDVRIDRDLREVVERQVQVSGAWIRTRKVELSKLGKIVGFTGRVVFFVNSEDPKVLRWLNALAKFGEFAGVGRKTTMGFGRVKVPDRPDDSPL
jgi:CRISPR-associated endoribonuclease Cas6